MRRISRAALVTLLVLTCLVSSPHAELISGSSEAPQGSTTPLTAPSYTSTAPNGTNGFACTTNGCRLDLGTGASDYWVSNGTNISTPAGVFVSGLLGADVHTTNSNGPVSLRGQIADGATAVGVKLGNVNTLATAGAQVAAFCQDTPITCATKVAAVDQAGVWISPQACNSTASPGAATCNQAAGRAAIAAGASTVVITNSLVTATSRVFVMHPRRSMGRVSTHAPRSRLRDRSRSRWARLPAREISTSRGRFRTEGP